MSAGPLPDDDELGPPSAEAAREIEGVYGRLRSAWLDHGGIAPAERRDVLRALRASLLRDKDAFVYAVSADFGGRSRHETLLAEVALLVQAID